jgi:hypothetical protein
MTLRDKLSVPPYLESDQAARRCLDALEIFLTVNSVDISGTSTIDAASAVSWGLPLAILGEQQYTHPFLARFSKPFSKQSDFNSDDFVELEAAALLLSRGAASLTPVDRTHEKTQDFDLIWSETNIEVEVTKSEAKDVHTSLRIQAQRIAQSINSTIGKFDLVVHVSKLLDTATEARLLDASREITIDQTIEEPNAWLLAAKATTRPVHEVLKAGEVEIQPSWWPSDMVSLFTISLTLAGPDSTKTPPRVKVCYAAPFTGYLNSAKKKARRFQGTLTRPYLMVVNVTDLPDAFEVYRQGLDANFQRWKHISGVLIFEAFKSTNEIGWTFQFYRNLHATRPLPIDMDLALGGSGMGRSRLVIGTPSGKL